MQASNVSTSCRHFWCSQQTRADTWNVEPQHSKQAWIISSWTTHLTTKIHNKKSIAKKAKIAPRVTLHSSPLLHTLLCFSGPKAVLKPGEIKKGHTRQLCPTKSFESGIIQISKIKTRTKEDEPVGWLHMANALLAGKSLFTDECSPLKSWFQTQPTNSNEPQPRPQVATSIKWNSDFQHLLTWFDIKDNTNI